VYPHRTEADDKFLETLPHIRYATDDTPHISTARYSLNSDYEPRDVTAKVSLDMQGAQDNLFWYAFNKRQDLINQPTRSPKG
jgi:hypothetical protein